MKPPPLPHQVDVLQRVLDRIAQSQQETDATPVVVFDLDGTLFDNRSRTLQILREYGDAVREQLDEVAEALDELVIDRVEYLLSDTLRVCNITHPDLVRDMTTFWRDRFFSDDYCSHDVPLEGAVEYVKGCYEAGATIVYLTGRDVPGMFLGTVASLRDHDFPVGVAGVELVLKPDATMPDEAFKRNALPTLGRIGHVVAFFDNEPANCNLVDGSQCISVLLDTQRVPGAPDIGEGVHTVADFRMTY